MRFSLLRAVVCLGTLAWAGFVAETSLSAGGRPKPDDRPCIEWQVMPGVEVNRSRAERIYDSARRWVDANFFTEGAPARPCVKIKVGEPCTGYKVDNCVSFIERTVYLKKWDDSAALLLAESFILMGVYDKFVNGGGEKIAHKLALDDLKNFVDVSELRKK